MGRRKRTEVRQDEIAKAVLELIVAEGHEAVSMVAVSKIIGVVPSALYRHFPSKDDMIIAAMKLHRDERLGELNQILERHDRVLPAYAEMISLIPCFVGQTAAIPRLTFGVLPHAGDKLRNEAKNLFEGFISKIASDFELAKQNGEIDASVNCRSAAMAVWGVLMTAVIRHSIFGTDFDAVKHVRNGWEFFLRAVQPDGQPSAILPADSPNAEVRR